MRVGVVPELPPHCQGHAHSMSISPLAFSFILVCITGVAGPSTQDPLLEGALSSALQGWPVLRHDFVFGEVEMESAA